MAIQWLVEKFLVILAAVSAALFVVAYIHCMVYLNAFDPRLRFELSFADVVKHTVYTASGPIFLTFLATACYILSLVAPKLPSILFPCINQLPGSVRSLAVKFAKHRTIWLALLGPVVFIIFAYALKPKLASLETMFCWLYEQKRIMVLSLCVSVIYIALVWDSGVREPQFWIAHFPFSILFPVIAALVVVSASERAYLVKNDWERSYTAIYSGSGAQEGCPIMSIERGLVWYERGKPKLIPWSQLQGLTGPEPEQAPA
jgi:hypothetical protein